MKRQEIIAMNEKFEKFIKDLSPELQEKARACKTNQELMELAAEEDIEIPMDALENVSGGCGDNELKCPYCGSTDIGSEPVNLHGTRLFCRTCQKTIRTAG